VRGSAGCRGLRGRGGRGSHTRSRQLDGLEPGGEAGTGRPGRRPSRRKCRPVRSVRDHDRAVRGRADARVPVPLRFALRSPGRPRPAARRVFRRRVGVDDGTGWGMAESGRDERGAGRARGPGVRVRRPLCRVDRRGPGAGPAERSRRRGPRARPAYRAPVRGPRPDAGRAVQPGDCRAAGRVRAHGQEPCARHPAGMRRGQPVRRDGPPDPDGGSGGHALTTSRSRPCAARS
jgi:hypothetical protein